MEHDYYKILQCKLSSTSKEIRASYRRLALTLHPDKNVSDPNATATFQLLSEAFTTLSHKRSRTEYDIKYRAYRRSLSKADKTAERASDAKAKYAAARAEANAAHTAQINKEMQEAAEQARKVREAAEEKRIKDQRLREQAEARVRDVLAKEKKRKEEEERVRVKMVERPGVWRDVRRGLDAELEKAKESRDELLRQLAEVDCLDCGDLKVQLCGFYGNVYEMAWRRHSFSLSLSTEAKQMSMHERFVKRAVLMKELEGVWEDESRIAQKLDEEWERIWIPEGGGSSLIDTDMALFQDMVGRKATKKKRLEKEAKDQAMREMLEAKRVEVLKKKGIAEEESRVKEETKAEKEAKERMELEKQEKRQEEEKKAALLIQQQRREQERRDKQAQAARKLKEKRAELLTKQQKIEQDRLDKEAKEAKRKLKEMTYQLKQEKEARNKLEIEKEVKENLEKEKLVSLRQKQAFIPEEKGSADAWHVEAEKTSTNGFKETGNASMDTEDGENSWWNILSEYIRKG